MKIQGVTVQLSKIQKAMIIGIASSRKGVIAYRQLLNNRAEEGRIRTIFALEEKGILRHKRSASSWDYYVHGFSPWGQKVAIAVLSEALEAEKVKHETPQETRDRRLGL